MMVNEDMVARAGDVVFVPANTEYRFEGSFKAVFVNSPPFRKENKSLSVRNIPTAPMIFGVNACTPCRLIYR